MDNKPLSRPRAVAKPTAVPAPSPVVVPMSGLLGAAILGGLVARALDDRPTTGIVPITSDPVTECDRVRVVEVHHHHERTHEACAKPTDDPDDDPRTGSQAEHECDQDDGYGM